MGGNPANRHRLRLPTQHKLGGVSIDSIAAPLLAPNMH
jgi:hypothetical protein